MGLEEICPHCGVQKNHGANNPVCDHLFYPENCVVCAQREHPQRVQEPHSALSELLEKWAAYEQMAKGYQYDPNPLYEFTFKDFMDWLQEHRE